MRLKQGRMNPKSANDKFERRCRAADRRATRHDRGSNLPRKEVDMYLP